MTYNMKGAAALLVPVLLSAMLIGCAAKKPSDKDGKLSIVCTNFSEYDWTREIIGETDSANVTYLLESGMDIHNYQPSAEDIMTISDCDMFIYVGGESESWVDDALSTKTNKNMKVVKLFEAVNDNIKLEEHKEGMEEEEEHYHDEDEPEYDEHVWLSVRNAELICNDICDKLCELDSANADTYKANLADYTDKLRALDGEYSKMAENAKVKTLLFGDRFPFRYLVEDYGLDYYAAFKGCSAETEASFETIAKLAEKLDELKLNNVFIIENSSDAIAKSIISSSGNKNASIEKLNSLQSVTSDDIKKGATYISIMKNDLETLKKVLN
ncbi:zinc transport system substrate-binding protein [Ruminococcus flavefaciens]|uniref:Zinc transport system substrate-binding protein n=1 Tax=Ruminococcus flavefaciens TaxID=1265 RepID=A0A1H6KCL8_RUMFL|nr:metal ABC transporter substrate-binding protein [Ruminococcus flavefaciens]SEH73238.1 zinc transport system substrate-binding protein [Ruminococcus flavefaciens]